MSPRCGTRRSTFAPRRPTNQARTVAALLGISGTRISLGTAVVAVWATSSTLVAADSPLRREASPLGPLRGRGLDGARSPTPTEVVVPEEVGAPLWWTAPASAGSMREA